MLKTRGLTLIEMIIGIAILSVLMALAIPNFSAWIENMKIRGTAETLLSGLQLARAEALKDNETVSFSLNDAPETCDEGNDAPRHWIVNRGITCSMDAASLVSVFNGKPTGDKTLIDTTSTHFVFNGLGRQTKPGSNAHIDIKGSGKCVSDGGTARCLRIAISTGGGIRLCDPALPTTDAQACS